MFPAIAGSAIATTEPLSRSERESFGWFVRFVRRLGRRYGNIHFAFGDPISLTKAMGAPRSAMRNIWCTLAETPLRYT